MFYAKGNLTCEGNLTAPNIYTKAETDNLLATKATIAYVDDQLLLKANQATTYTITEVDTRLSGKQNTLISRILRNWIRLLWVSSVTRRKHRARNRRCSAVKYNLLWE